MKRRTFLKQLSVITIGAGTARTAFAKTELLSASLEKTLESVLNIILPSEENSPGAKDTNTLYYLKSILVEPLVGVEDREFLKEGLHNLNDFSKTKHGKSFAGLHLRQQEEILESYAASSQNAKNWLSLMITYSLEGFLCDPCYGGNKDALGWKHVEYIPGFPRPTSRRWYAEKVKIR